VCTFGDVESKQSNLSARAVGQTALFVDEKSSQECDGTGGCAEAHQKCRVVLWAVLPSPPVYVYADIGRGACQTYGYDDIPEEKNQRYTNIGRQHIEK
jgi:hypothetical protein